MRNLRPIACALAALSAAACSTAGGDAPPPIVNTPVGTVDQLNTTLGPISYGSPDNGQSVDEAFGAASAGLTLAQSTSGTGLEFVSMTQGDFSNLAPNDDPSISSVTFDTATNSLTFDIQNGDLNLQDTIGPIIMSDPGNFANLLNDDLAILISAFPGSFPSGEGFTPSTYAGNAAGVDSEIERIRDLGTESASEYLARLNEIAQVSFLDRDFYSYGRGAYFYSQLKITGTNSGTTTNYVALGIWNNPPAASSAGDISYGATVYGSPTPPGELPDSGTATYNTTIVGWLLRQNKVEELRGGVTLDVDFSRRNLSAAVDADIVVSGPSGESIFTDFTTLSGDGEITAQNRFFGDLRGIDDPSMIGDFEGAFYGPGAAEAGGTFNFSNADVAAAAGFVGPRDGDIVQTNP